MKVRADIMKLSKSMHTWVGIFAGTLLFICFFAGGLSMFQHQLSQWATPPNQVLPAVQIQQLNQLIANVQQQHPAAQKSFTLNLNSTEFHYAPMMWTEGRGGGRHAVDATQKTWLASLDEHGQTLIKQEPLAQPGHLIEQLHETAGIPGTLGHDSLGVTLMGVVCVLYFLALFSGLILLLPTLVKDFFAIRAGKNKKRFWLDTHNVIGVTSLPFHVIISVTVVVFAFHDIFYDTLQFASKQKKSFFLPPTEQVIDQAVPKLDINQILAQVKKVSPEYSVSYIQLNNLNQPEKSNARIAVYSSDQMLRGATQDFMTMNPYKVSEYNNKFLNTETGAWNKLVNSMFSLHFGSFGGTWIRWMYVLLGLAGAFLFYSGNILWVETRARKRKNPNDAIPEQRKDVRLLANLTIGSCLGCVLAIFSSMLIGKWSYALFNPLLITLNQLFIYIYYVVFLGSIGYAFAIGAAKALPQFLLAIAIVLLAIPLTAIVSYLMPSLGLWHYTGDLIWIDIIALLISFVFLRFYRQAKRRSKTADQGSLWAVSTSRSLS